MDLDLNQEPSDSNHGSMLGLGSLLNELETTHGHIEEHIRRLQAVTSRARHRQRWRQNQTSFQPLNSAPHPTAPAVQVDGGTHSGEVALERGPETSKTYKMNSTFLIAKALGMDADAKKTGTDVGRFFDCNICLIMARDPILTSCGHLFCWPCFYQLSYVHSNVKECPVCMEEVTDTSIIPIYGNGNGNYNQKFNSKESGLKVPPRPQAHRIESVRQQLINHGVVSSPVEERIRRFNSMLLEMQEGYSSRDRGAVTLTAERTSSLANLANTSQLLPAMDIEGSQHQHSLQVSRLLLQEAASFSSLSTALSSAMDSAERLLEDLEEFIHRYRLRRNLRRSSRASDSNSFSSISTDSQPDRQITDVTAGGNSILPHSDSSFQRNGSTTQLPLGIQRRDTAVGGYATFAISSSSRRTTEISRLLEVDSIEINSTVPDSSSSRQRRTEVPGDSDVDTELFHESRRRRLR